MEQPDVGLSRGRSEAGTMLEWQSVETAPKDGTPIIGGFLDIRWADSHKRDDVVRCWYRPEFEAFISSCRQMTMHGVYQFEDGSKQKLHSPVIEPITHWVPMPAVPSKER